MAFIESMLPTLLGTGAAATQMAVQGGPKRQYKWNKKAAEDANRMNRENQEYILAENRRLQAEQREYDSPAAQKQRFIDAGLNPNLVYGNGSSAGSAFPIEAGQVAPVRVDAPSAQYPNVGDAFIRGSQAGANLLMSEVKREESAMRTQSMAMQVEIAKTNPMLNPDVAAAVADSLGATAALKAREAHVWQAFGEGEKNPRYLQKIEMEVEQMSQRLGLNTVDLKIRNRILESKEFENAVKELNAKWLKDSEMTPEHIRQGIMLILSKMLGR